MGAANMADALALTRKVFRADETQFTPGERSMVAWISTDVTDHERDVVVSSGIDYKTYFMGKSPEEGNPCVLAFHDLGRWPLGRCEWVKIKQSREWNGLYAKTIFDDDPETETVWRKIKSGSLKGISIGFRPPDDLKPGEWGPPTREELLRRPDWHGAQRIIRRCVLLEYSVCSLPMNAQALVIAVNKGVHRPVYSLAKGIEMDQDTPEVEADEPEDKAAEECKCGKDDCKECMERKGDDEEAEAEPETPEAKAMDDAEDDFDEEDESSLPIKTRDHVDVKAKGFKGCGIVEKIHRKGAVEHVDEDLIGTREDPAARVRLYKAHGDGHLPMEKRMGARLSQLTKRADPFKTPSKKAFAEAETKAANSPTGEKPEPLPPLVALSEAEFQNAAIKKATEAAVNRVNEMFGVV